MILLRRGPDALPASPRLLQQILLLNALSGIVVLSTQYEAGIAVSSTLLDLALMLGFTWILLQALHRQPRFVQTATALSGVGIVFHLLLWPALLTFSATDTDEVLRTQVGISMLLVMSWELLVIAHIFRCAIESSMGRAIALSFALFIISITVSQLVIPGAS